jgi:HTH-type transcriptional regulator, glycine betaine synthesis regulator
MQIVKPREFKEMNPQLELALDSFIESAGKISANMLGMVSKVGGQIYALLFLSRRSLSLDEISEALKISKGNISINVRMLEEHKLVNKVWVKGTRKDYYEANRDYPRKFLKSFMDRVREGIEDSLRVINKCHNQFEETQKELQGEEKEDAEFMAQQLNLLSAFYLAASEIFEDFYQGRDINTDLLRRAILD